MTLITPPSQRPSSASPSLTREPVSSTPDQETSLDNEAIQDNVIPLFGGDGHWALINLILALAGVLTALIVLTKRLAEPRQNEHEKN